MRLLQVNTTQKHTELVELMAQIEADYSVKGPKNWEAIAEACSRAESIAKELKDEPTRYKILLRRAESTGMNHGYQTAQKLARECIDYYTNVNKALLLNAVQTAGNSSWNLGDYGLALEYYEHSFHLSTELGLEYDKSMAFTNLGAVHSRFGQYEQAIEFYESALQIKYKLNDIRGVAIVFGNMGNVYQYQKNYNAALEYYQQSITSAYEVKDTAHIARMLNNMGAMYQFKNEYTQALDYFLQALNLIREESASDSHPSIPTLLGHLGEIYHSLEQFDVAESYMTQGLEIVIKQGNQSRLHAILYSLSTLYSNENYREFSLLKAKEYCNQALQIAREINERPAFSKYTSRLAEIDFRLGNYAEAYMYLRNSIEVETDLHSKELEDKLRIMQVHHKVEQLKKEAEIERLKNAVLEVSNKHLEELNAIKNNFLGIAAHDLKNPLSSIKMLARLLEDYAGLMPTEEVQKVAKDICTSCSQMFDLIVGLLDVNAIEQGKINLTLQETDVSCIVMRITDSYMSRAKEKGIVISLEYEECTALIDTTKFIQITENLISNAIKYSPLNTSVFIRIFNESAEYVRLSVRDEGPGIAPGEMHKLFDKFQRLEAQPTGGEHSTGLGLSIVKQLTELMNGRVWCESIYGEGATFIVEFPAYDLARE